MHRSGIRMLAIRVTLPRDLHRKRNREEAEIFDCGGIRTILVFVGFFRNFLQEHARTDSASSDTAVIFSRPLRAIINPYGWQSSRALLVIDRSPACNLSIHRDSSNLCMLRVLASRQSATRASGYTRIFRQTRTVDREICRRSSRRISPVDSTRESGFRWAIKRAW